MENKFTFKVESIRTMASPNKINGISSEDSETLYYLMVNMNDLPDDLPLDVNPRQQKMTTNVAKKLLVQFWILKQIFISIIEEL